MPECEHSWEWLPRPVHYVAPLGNRGTAFNVECSRCGARAWAHGQAPNVSPIVVTITPTTGRNG